jgi:hypothetical protein
VAAAGSEPVVVEGEEAEAAVVTAEAGSAVVD